MQSDNREFDRLRASWPFEWYGLTLSNLTAIIIYIQKLLDSDWLKTSAFFV